MCRDCVMAGQGQVRGIECRERFIHQQQARAGQQRPAKGNLLPLAARKPSRAPAEQRRDAQQRRHFLKTRPGRPGRRAAQAVAEIAPGIEMRKQACILEFHGAAQPLGGHCHAGGGVQHRRARKDHVPIIRPKQPGDGRQDRALATSRRSEQRRDAGPWRGEGHIEREAPGIGKGPPPKRCRNATSSISLAPAAGASAGR